MKNKRMCSVGDAASTVKPVYERYTAYIYCIFEFVINVNCISLVALLKK